MCGGDVLKLRLLTGLAATGKSTWCYEDICNQLLSSKDILFLVVPSHLIHDAEEEILARVGGYDRLKVLTIPQLAAWVLREMGSSRKTIGSIERQLLLQTVLHDCKQSLKVFGEAANRYRFTQAVGNTLSLIQQNGISAGRFADLVEERGISAPKLVDLALILRTYAERLGDKDDPELVISRATSLLTDAEGAQCRPGAESVAFEKVKVWLDGYLWLSPLEQEFIVRLAQRVNQVTVTSLLLPSETNEMNARRRSDGKLPVHRSFLRGIRRAAEQLGIPVEERCFSGHEHLPVGLGQIAGAFLTNSASSVPGSDSVCIAQYPDEATETLWTAARILSLIRDGKARWRDIVVVVGDMGNYRKELVHTFWHYGIPHNLSSTEQASSHPLIALMLQLVKVVDTNLALDAVIELFKSPLWPGSYEEKDLLEEHARKLGIGEKMWTWEARRSGKDDAQLNTGEEASTSSSEGDQGIDEVFRRLLTPLKSFWESVGQAKRGVDFLRALWEVVRTLRLDSQAEASSVSPVDADGAIMSQESRYCGTARLDEYVWKQLVAVFDCLYEQLGDRDITWEDFSFFWKGGLEQIRLSQDLGSLDEVRIVSPQQASGISAPYVFVIGCIDGVFARVDDQDALIAPGEVAEVESSASCFPSMTVQQLNGEDQLGYVALTRATKKLWVSWSHIVRGRQAYPHASVNLLCRLFTDVSIREEDVLPASLWSRYELAAASIAVLADKRIRPVDRNVVSVYNWLCANARGRRALAKHLVCGTHLDSKSRMSDIVARKLYHEPFVTSISQLEEFSRCPFSHFLKYGLRLSPMRDYGLEITDYGILIHAGLREFFRLKQNAEGPIDRKLLGKWVDEILQELVEEVKEGIFSTSNRHRHFLQRIRARLLDAIEVLLEEEERSRFRQVLAEVEFGVESEAGSLEVRLGDGTSAWLRGKIDRVDVCESDGELWVRVWDYKLGSRGLDLVLVREGLSLQLLAYMSALVANGIGGKEVLPAAVQYFSVPDIFLNSACGPLEDAVHQKTREKGYQISGLFTDNKEILRMIDREIGSGDLYPIKLKKDSGGFYDNCLDRVASAEEWEKILTYVRGKMAELVGQILDGYIMMRPYRYGKECACDACDYKDICFFDIAALDYGYRVIRKPDRNSKKSALLDIARQMGGEKHE